MQYQQTSAAVALDPRRAICARCALDFAVGGIAGFLLLNLVLQAPPPHYSLVRQAVSDMTIGPYGWVMAVGFWVSDTLGERGVYELMERGFSLIGMAWIMLVARRLRPSPGSLVSRFRSSQALAAGAGRTSESMRTLASVCF